MRGSIHVKVRFKSSNGFESIEQGYSKVGDLDNNRDKLFKNAILSASQTHINHGGTYDSKYNILNTSIVYFTKLESGRRKSHEEKISIDIETQNKVRKKINKEQKNKIKQSRSGDGSHIKSSSVKSMYRKKGEKKGEIKMTKKTYKNKLQKNKQSSEHKELLRLRKENVKLRKQLTYDNKILKKRRTR